MLKVGIVLITVDEDGEEVKISETNNPNVYEVRLKNESLNCGFEEIQRLCPSLRGIYKRNIEDFFNIYK